MSLDFILIVCVLFAVVVPIAKNYLKSSKVKGKLGEMFIGAFLSRLGEEYEVINNVTLVTEEDSTQIDHIIVSLKGVWVIETKNYHGRIFGNEKDATWTQRSVIKHLDSKIPSAKTTCARIMQVRQFVENTWCCGLCGIGSNKAIS